MCFFFCRPSKKGMGFGPVVVYAWHGANSKIVMAIWKMARDQHMFYRSKRTNKVSPCDSSRYYLMYVLPKS